MIEKKCKACGYSSVKNISFEIQQGDRGTILWMFCNNCSSFFSTYNYDKQMEIYHTSNYTSWGNEEKGKMLCKYKIRMYNFIAEKITRIKPPQAELLDIGCSYGGFLFEMRNRGYMVEGIDIVPKAIEYVKSKNINAQQCFSINDIKVQKLYDIISILDSNCYWNDQVNELRCIYSRLKANGLLIMRVVNKSLYLKLGLKIRIINKYLGDYLIKYSVNDHLFSMPVKSLVKELKKIGFNLAYSSPKGAIHSYESNIFVKILFKIGEIVHFLTGKFIAPGVIIIARKD